jgi:3-phenylpropionate/cinnamic acid dioxygenase small subunit
MSDKDEIMSLLNRYSHTVDSGDIEGFVALFEKGEWYVEGLTPNRGSNEVFENVLSKVIIYDDGTPRTRHVNANIELSIDEKSGTAKGQRYVTVLQQTDSLPLQAIFSGHYYDEFVKENGEWRFAKTVVHQPFVGDMSQHLKSEDFIEG